MVVVVADVIGEGENRVVWSDLWLDCCRLWRNDEGEEEDIEYCCCWLFPEIKEGRIERLGDGEAVLDCCIPVVLYRVWWW